MNKMHIYFHGVRGSLAAPGIHTARVGGNTSCVEINAGSTRIVLDAGTGMRPLGNKLIANNGIGQKTTILLSHVHWDHIQGLPFFAPLYVPDCEIDVISGPNGVMPLKQVLRQQMSPPCFPVTLDDLPSRMHAIDVGPRAKFTVGDVAVSMTQLNHPDPVYAYRLDWNGRAVVYATDTEHYSCVDPGLRSLAADADVLIYDAQYTPEEYCGDAGPSKVGWGHSTYTAAVQLARAAGVRQLVLFHHDPMRSDAQVADIERRSQALFANSIAAREGSAIALATDRGQRDREDGLAGVTRTARLGAITTSAEFAEVAEADSLCVDAKCPSCAEAA